MKIAPMEIPPPVSGVAGELIEISSVPMSAWICPLVPYTRSSIILSKAYRKSLRVLIMVWVYVYKGFQRKQSIYKTNK